MVHIDANILVVGAGGAGLRAALAAKEKSPGLKVVVMTQGDADSDSLTARACSDRMAFHVAFEHTPPGGDAAWQKHADDIYAGGGYVSDPNLAMLLAKNAAGAFHYLDRLGVPWVRDADGRPEQFRTDGSEHPRACYTGPYTARDIHRALLKEAKHKGIGFLENRHLIGLAEPSGDESQWVITAWDASAGMAQDVHASAVILATGGPGALFASPLYPSGADAIPFFVALQTGAKLVNLEFIQFGLISPKTGLACSGSIPRCLPKVVNQDGEEILAGIPLPGGLESYLELLFMKAAAWPVSAESPALAVDIEIWQTTSSGGNVYLNFRNNPSALNEGMYAAIVSKHGQSLKDFTYAPTPIERLERDNPQVIKWFAERGIDLRDSPVQICHAAQHFQGGILIDENAATGVPGLFACGECAGGQHGANRPGGNSLLDGQVMGAIAGANAAEFAAGKGAEYAAGIRQSSDMGKYFNQNGLAPDEVVSRLSRILSERMGVVRTGRTLLHALNEINKLFEEGIRAEPSNHEAAKAIACLVVSKAFVSAALLRDESRGSHILSKTLEKADLVPRDDPEGRFRSVAYSDNNVNKLCVTKQAIPELRGEHG